LKAEKCSIKEQANLNDEIEMERVKNDENKI
jgi:hypothetical protein